MALYAGHVPKIRKVTNGRVFFDDFNRPNGPVGNFWESLGPDSSVIDTNNLKIDATTVGQTSGITKPIFTEPAFRNTCEIYVRLETLTKNTTTGAKAVIAVYKTPIIALLIEIKTGDGALTWNDNKVVNIISYKDGVLDTLTSVSRTIDTTTSDNLFRVSITPTGVEVNYLEDGQFNQANVIAASHYLAPITIDSKIGLFAYEAEVDYESVEIRAHEKVYLYGLPNTWYVDIGPTRYNPTQGIITLDTSYMDINVNDMFDITLTSKANSPATAPPIEYDIEVKGGDSIGVFNFIQLVNPAGGGIPAGKVSTASRKLRKPVVFLDAEWAPATILDYSTPISATAVPIRSNHPGTVTIKFIDVETNNESVFTSFSIAPNIEQYVKITTDDLPPNRKTLVRAEFEAL